MTASAVRRAPAVPLPRTWHVRGTDVVAVLLGNAIFIVAMWVRHGGLEQLGTPGGAFIAIGQLTALLGTYLTLLQLLLMARTPWLDQAFGMDRLAWAHRWIGFSTLWLIAAHGLFTTIGYAAADGTSFLGEAWTILTTFDFVLIATVGFGLFVAVGVTSMRIARRRLPYEKWFLIHLLAYAAIAMGFLHQVFVGADFMHDGLARVYWIALYAITAVTLVGFRVLGPIRLNLRHRFRVSRIVQEGPGVVSIYISGRNLDRLPLRSGQYFIWRFLDGPRPWIGHPFSISSAPNGAWIRTTVKALGDDTRRLQRLRPGTRVLLEGPYGVLTGMRRTRRKVTMIAGGIGITPLRALMESLPADRGDLTLLYRARHPRHLILREELDALASRRGAIVHYLVGRRGSDAMPADPLGPAAILRRVPDIADHDVYICGPAEMMDRLTAVLDELGLPAGRIHAERFAY
ncbi:MAG: ferric reductase-like transmembrane domain-containing protein [Candidatus Limnocylindrales bacterium]